MSTYVTSPLARGLLAMVVLGWTCIAHAELAVGSFANPGQVRIFADGAAGNAPPFLTIGGPATGLQTPASMAFEPYDIEMYVSDYDGRTIRVFDPRLTGDQLPIRTLNLPVRPVRMIVHHIYTGLTFVGFGVYTYAPAASGNTPPARVIDWGGAPGSVTRLDAPAGLVALASTDELVVGDFERSSESGEILAFPRTANGNVAPAREIRGPLTALGSNVVDLAIDRSRCELYALVIVAAGGRASRVAVFHALDEGNVEPQRVIEGPLTLIDGAGGIEFDAANDRLWVTTGYDAGTTPRLLAFSSTADGNVAPVAVVEGSATGLSVPFDVLPYQLPDPMFGDGFEELEPMRVLRRPLGGPPEERCDR